MFVTGVLGIFQMLFLPGLIARKLMRFPGSLFVHLAAVMAVSMIFNHAAGLALAGMGLFTRGVWLGVFALEAGWALKLYWKSLKTCSLDDLLAGGWNAARNAAASLFNDEGREEKGKLEKVLIAAFRLAFLVAALVGVEWISRFLRNNLGSVFSNWDDVVSWNRWAVEWATNQIPSATEDYPQLIPLNWAVAYLMMGTTKVQLFAKAVMPLFSLMTALMLLGAGFTYRNAGYFAAVVLLRLMLKKFSGEFIASGYVDLPLAFIAVLSMLVLYEGTRVEEMKGRRQFTLLAILIASGAAVTKQPGLYLLAGVMVLAFFFTSGLTLLRKPLGKEWQNWLPALFIPLVVVVPWYGYKFTQILSGAESSHLFTPLEHSSQVHASAGMLNNILPGLLSLEKYFFLVLFLIPAVLVIEKFWRAAAIGMILPFTLLWAAYASYDIRNLTMMFPLIAIVAGLGINRYYEMGARVAGRIKAGRIKLWMLLVLALAIIGGLGVRFSGDRLMGRQIEEQKKLFSPSLNEGLYSFFETNPKGKILTNYPVDHLPELEGLQVNFYYQNYTEFKHFVENTDLTYLLVPANRDDEIGGYIAQETLAGRMELIFENEDYIRYQFFRILK